MCVAGLKMLKIAQNYKYIIKYRGLEVIGANITHLAESSLASKSTHLLWVLSHRLGEEGVLQLQEQVF